MSLPPNLTEQMLQLKRGTEEFAAARRVATLPDCGAATQYEPAEHPKCAIAQLCKAMHGRRERIERGAACAVVNAVANVAAAFTSGSSSSFTPATAGDGAVGDSVLHAPPSVRDVLKAALFPSARAEMLAAVRAAHSTCDGAPPPSSTAEPHSHHPLGAATDSSTTMGEKAGSAERARAHRGSHKQTLLASVSDFGDRVFSHVFGSSPHQRRAHTQPHPHHADARSPRSPVQHAATAEPSMAAFSQPTLSTTAMRGDDSPARSSRSSLDSDGSHGRSHGQAGRVRARGKTTSALPPLARASVATSAPSLRSSAAVPSHGSGADLSRSSFARTRTHFMPHATSIFDPFVAAATDAAAASERRREARQRERDKRANEFAADVCIFENNEDTQRAYIEEVAESVFQALRAEAADEFGKLRSAQWWDGRKETLTERMTKHVVETYFRRMHGYARQNFRFLFSATHEGVPKPWHQHHVHHQHHHRHHSPEHRRFHLRHDTHGGIVASPEEIACATRVARACGAQLVVDMALTDDDESSMDFLVLPGQRISLANCPPDKLYLYYAFMAFKSHKEAFSDLDSLTSFRAAARDVFLNPEGEPAKRHLCTLQAAQMIGFGHCSAGASPSAAAAEVSINELESRCLNDADTRSALGRRIALFALRHAMDMISASAYFPRLALELYARVLSLESHLRSDAIDGAGVEFMVNGADVSAASQQNAGLGGCITAAARGRTAVAAMHGGEMSFAVDDDTTSAADASFGRALTPAPSLVFQAGGADAAAKAEAAAPVGAADSAAAVSAAAGAGPQESAVPGALIARTLSVFRGADDESAGEPFSPSSAVASPTAHSDSSTFEQGRIATTPAFATSAQQLPTGKASAAAVVHHRARAASASTPVDLGASTMSSSVRAKSAAHHRDAQRAALPEHMRLLIGDVLGKGATGCVYAAMCTDTSRMLALKEMRIRDVTRTSTRSKGGHPSAAAAPPAAVPPAKSNAAVTPSTAVAAPPPTTAVAAVAAPVVASDAQQRAPTYDSSDEEVPNVDTLGLTTGAFDLRSPGTSASPTFGAQHVPPPPLTALVSEVKSEITTNNGNHHHHGLRPQSFHHSAEESLIPKVANAPTHTEMCVGEDDVTYSPTVDLMPCSQQPPPPAAAPATSDALIEMPPAKQMEMVPYQQFAAPARLPLEEEGMLTITQDSATTSGSTSSRGGDDEMSSGSESDTEGPLGEGHLGARRESTSAENTTSTAQRTATTTTASTAAAPMPTAAAGVVVALPTPTSTSTGGVVATSSSRAVRHAGATAAAITEEEQRVVDEINLLRRLRHENIVAYLGCKWDRLHGVVYIVMELCPHSLRDIRKSLKTMPLSLIAHYARGVLSGLRYLHDQHIVHRDIKAANILVTDQGVVKVSDFGVSVTVADDEENEGDAAGLEESENLGTPASRSANAIKRRILCGTPCFIAPELFNGASCSEASDIWSFGCLMVELASGSSPWWNYPNHNGLWQIARRLRAGVAPTLPKTPAQAAALRMAASATGVGSSSIDGAAGPEASADAASSGALISGLQSLPSGSQSGQPHPALLDMGAPLTCVEGATEATPAFEDFVAQCLAFDTCRRPTAAALLAHPFLNPRA